MLMHNTDGMACTNILYIHGLGQTAESWAKTIDSSDNDKAYDCIELTTILNGREATYGNLYSAFCKVCNSHTEPLMLCGLSLGAVLALNYAIDNPTKVSGLVLIAPQYKMPKSMLKLQNVLFMLMPKSAFGSMGFSKSDFIRLCATMAELDFSGSLDRITCPTLTVCGEKDGANKKAAMQLSGLLPNAQVKIIGGSGHEVNIDEPEKLAKEIDCFIKGVIL